MDGSINMFLIRPLRCVDESMGNGPGSGKTGQ